LSRGINPKFVSRNTKISHSKSTHFQKWKSNHKFEEVQQNDLESLEEDAMLDRYLSSRGINPKFATKMIKISHAKSHEFEKWKIAHGHMFEDVVTEETDKKDMICMDIPLIIRVLEFTREEMSSDIELHNMVERLINMRHDVPLDMTHYDAITSKLVKEEILDESPKEGGKRKFSGMYNPAPKGTFAYDQAMRKKKHDEIEKNVSKDGSGMTSAIDRLQKHLNREETELNESSKDNPRHPMHQSDPSLYKKTAKSITKQYATHAGKFFSNKDNMDFTVDYKKTDKEAPRYKNEETELDEMDHKFIDSLNKLSHKHKEGDHVTVNSKFFGKQKGKVVKVDSQSVHVQRDGKKFSEKYPHDAVMKEEALDEISKSTLASYKDKSSASLKNAQANRDAAEAGKHMSKGFADLHAKSDAITKKRVKGLIGYMQRKQGMKPTSENTLDPLAATEAPCDGANGGDDSSEKKRQLSKSARMIKSLYKKHNMKEEMYDWEKDDKNQTSPGKKNPKLAKSSDESNFGSNKPQARAVMSGGKTMTGEKRDVVEIDPLLKNRPDLNGNTKDVTDKKNNKINN
jgi:hypothetical protein